jgi:hypothetical protein
VRYEAAGAPLAVYVCHCRECQKQSASAFGISVILPRASVRVTRGRPKFCARTTDGGGELRGAFCPDCGSRLWHERDAAPGSISIKGGSLDEPPDLGRAVHIWTARKLAGVAIPPDCIQYPGEPPD